MSRAAVRTNRHRPWLAAIGAAMVLGAGTAAGCSKVLGIEEGTLQGDGLGGTGGLAEGIGGTGTTNVSSSSSSGSGTGGVGECATAADCPDPVDAQCQTVTCVAATCQADSQEAGEATASQLAGDCKEINPLEAGSRKRSWQRIMAAAD